MYVNWIEIITIKHDNIRAVVRATQYADYVEIIRKRGICLLIRLESGKILPSH